MKKNLFLLVLFFLFSSPALAGYISLETSLSAEVQGSTLWVTVSAQNNGDESAYAVQGEISAAGKNILLQKRPELGVKETYSVRVPVKLDLGSPGEYPLTLRMHYADANQYPFSALTCKTFFYRSEGVPASIFGSIAAVRLWREGEIELRIKNIGQEDKKIAFNILLPRELSLERGPSDLSLAARSESKIRFKVKNFSALNGSNYQIFAIAEHHEDGIYQTSIIPGVIVIREEKTIFGLGYPVFIAALALLLAVFVILQLWGKQKN